MTTAAVVTPPSTAITVNESVAELPKVMLAAGESLVTRALSVRVTDAETYQLAATIAGELKEQKKARLAWFKPMKDALNATKNLFLAREKQAIEPLDHALAHVDGQATTWRVGEERKAREERERLQREADKEAERIRKQEIALAKKEGDKRLAKQLENAPVVAPPVKVESAVPSVAGLGTRKRTVWKFEVTNAAAVPREWCAPDEKAIGEYVRRYGEDAIGKIPGVKVFADEHTL